MTSDSKTSEIKSRRMPVLFAGHGSPMNAIDDNEFTRTLNALGKKIPRPRLILMVSAHWMSEGTWLTGMKNPKTIHDFYGFPKELFDIQYPAPGSPEAARQIQERLRSHSVNLDMEMWGLDHGTWSVLRHMYPDADIPVVQLSLYMEQPPEYHYKLGQHLSQFRDEGILIIGSGNIVHNLRRIDWQTDAVPHDWALEFDEWSKKKLESRDFSALTNDFAKSESGRLSVPTPDHYYPLLYVLGASDANDELRFDFEGIQNASVSMRTFTLTPQNSL